MRVTYLIANELQRSDVGDLIIHDILQLKQNICVCGGCVCKWMAGGIYNV